jgi:hypothetical protein
MLVSPLVTRLKLIFRAYTSPREEAFASPNVFWACEKYWQGDNSLSIEEYLLIDEYEKRGRPDLADCIRSGRKYNRLNHVLGSEFVLVRVNAMTEAFLGEEAGILPQTDIAWREWALGKFEGQDKLIRVKERMA